MQKLLLPLLRKSMPTVLTNINSTLFGTKKCAFQEKVVKTSNALTFQVVHRCASTKDKQYYVHRSHNSIKNQKNHLIHNNINNN